MSYFSLTKKLIASFFLVSFSLLSTNSKGQVFFQKTIIDTILPLNRVADIVPLIDDGCILLDNRGLKKMSCDGMLEWEKKKNYSGGELNSRSLIKISDEQIMLAIPLNGNGGQNKSYIGLLKLDISGNIIWQKQYGKLWESEVPRSIISTHDGGFLIGGALFQPQSYLFYDFYFIKTDSLGQVEWAKVFGETFITNNIEASVEDEWGNTIHIGGNIREDGSLVENGFILKLNSDGEIIFYKELEKINHNFFAKDLLLTSNGNILITGYTYNINDNTRKAFLVQLDSVGELVNVKNLKTASTVTENENLAITTLQNGGYLLAGHTANFLVNTLYPELFYPFICVLNEDLEILNFKIFDYHPIFSGTAEGPKSFLDIKESNNGDIYLSFGHGLDLDNPLDQGVMVMKIDANLSETCNALDVSDDVSFIDDDLGEWMLIDIPTSPISYGNEYDNIHLFDNQPLDSIFTHCETVASADFSFENACPNSTDPIFFFDGSEGNNIFREWNFNDGAYITNEQNPTFDFVGTGSLPVQLIVSDGCVTDTIERIIEVLPNTSTERDTLVCSGRPIVFNNQQYIENVNEPTSFVYTDTLWNILGCDSIDQFTVLVEPCGCELIFPNVFTPDGDGVNDFFQPIADCDFTIENYRLLIFNRWGQVVFETKELEEKWDGTFQENQVPSDVFVFRTQYEIKDDEGNLKSENRVGDITLIR